MAEVLVTLGIIAVLLAVAVPGVIAARANLKMTELDATAREIFLAAQNNLTGRMAAGTLGEVGTPGNSQARFLRDGDPGMDALLPTGAIDPTVAGNHYIIRLNLEYATVLDVFYSEEGFGMTPEEIYGAMGPDAEGAAAARREAKIGYYNGGDLELAPPEQLAAPRLEVVNNDELRVNLTVPDYAQYQAKGVKLTLRIEDANNPQSFKDFPLDFPGGTATLLLDDLSGTHFYSLCDKKIASGAQIRITATLSADRCLPASASAETNSLFADRQGDTVYIAYGRHLQNLSVDTSSVYGVTAAVQTAEITWPEGFSFIPIQNYDLLSYNGNKLPLRELSINSDAVKAINRKSYGLFGDIWGSSIPMEINGVRIVNPDIRIKDGDTGTNVGALAGSATNVEITDCLVYLERDQETADYSAYAISGHGSVGGLVGKASKCTIISSAAGLYSVSGGLHCEYLGGLLGQDSGSTIENSYASIDQLGGAANTAAMFVGQGDNTEVKGCYAVGNLSAAATTINGFMGGGGTSSSGGIESSYCAVTYNLADGQPRPAGFQINFGFSGAGNRNCAYLEVGADPRYNAAGAEAKSYSELAGTGWNGSGTKFQSPTLCHPYRAELDGKTYPFEGLKADNSPDPIPHYGSWPLPDEDLTLAYYEIYADGAFGMWLDGTDTLRDNTIVKQDGYALLSPVDRTPPTVSYTAGDGKPQTAECVPYGDGTVTVGVGKDAKEYYVYLLPAEAVQTGYANKDYYQQLSCGAQTFWYNPHFAKAIPADQTAPKKPGESDLISVRSARQLVALGDHSAYWGNEKSTFSYIQELDIDYFGYDSSYVTLTQASIGTFDAPFKGAYDGGGHKIGGLSVPHETYYGGLFGASNGTIKALSVSPAAVLYNGANLADAGILVGYNTGTVTECSVFFEKEMTFTSLGYWGGLVGINRGSITNSFVTGNAHIKASGTAAGFVGWNLGKISSCYSNLKLESGTSASGFVVLNNYVSAGEKEEVGTVQDCYALLDAGSSGTAAGFSAMGGGGFTDCYAVLRADGRGNNYGFAPSTGGSFENCCYLSGDYTGAQAGDAKTYAELAELKMGGTAWGVKTAEQSHPYAQGLKNLNYPFPGLSALDHYGDWPLDIAVYNRLKDGSFQRINVIPVPSQGQKTVYVELRNGASAVPGKISCTPGAHITVKAAADVSTDRTALTVSADQSATATYVDLASGGTALRVAAVVYEAKITLTGNRVSDTGTSGNAVSTADSSGKSEVKQLTLNHSQPTGAYTAKIEVSPGKEAVLDGLAYLQAEAPAGTVWSTQATDFEGWDALKDGDPAVTANGSPQTGSHVLLPVGGDYYPKASNGKLTVTGAASGTATVSARWAMDETLAADGDIKMAGARALIYKAEARGTRSGALGSGTYPYRLSLAPQPQEDVTLTLTPELFSSTTGGSYVWTLYKSGVEKPIDTATNFGGPCTLSITDADPDAAYYVTLEYTNKAQNDYSTDYMLLSTYRATASDTDIRLYQEGKDAALAAGGTVSVEQIHSGEYPTADQATLTGYVAGAGNTRLKWSVSTDHENWQPVTGNLSSVAVRDGDGVLRATAAWDAEDGTKDGNLTGGSVTITAEDVNDYDAPFNLYLRAEAMEYSGTTAPYRDITVSVMPKLQINPETKVVRSGKTVTFKATRTEPSWGDYSWKVNSENEKSERSGAYSITASGDSTYSIVLEYGPFVGKNAATASLASLDTGFLSSLFGGEVAGIINWDGKQNDQYYFFLEKGTSRTLEFSWFSTAYFLFSLKVTSEPSTISDYYSRSNREDSPGNTKKDGSGTYTFTGINFTPNGTLLSWALESQALIPVKTVASYMLYVVGLDITDQSGRELSDTGVVLNAPNAAMQLNADWYFPENLRTTAAVTWTSDNPELVTVDQNGLITAHKYGASATITATCTVACTNGRTYTYSDHLSVSVEPQGEIKVALTPCNSGDLAALNQAFPGENLTAGSLLAAADKEGKPVLLADAAFGCDTLYLKAEATAGGSPADLSQYLCRVYSDEFYLETAEASIRNTLYIRLQAKDAAANPTALNISVEIGSKSASIPVMLYRAPTLTLYKDGSDVTNGSTPVTTGGKAPTYSFKAVMTPELHPYHTPGKLLDSILWYLECPAGYDAERYLSLTDNGDGSASVAVKSFPDFRVVIHAQSALAHDPDSQSELADGGHALVFLPEKAG